MPVAVAVPAGLPVGDGAVPGAPRAWLLIGPLARASGLWGASPAELLAQLRTVQPEATLSVLDLPGTGVRCRDASPAGVPALLAQLRERVGQAGLEGPFGLVATSWSTALAVEWARSAPGDVAALVLVSPAFRPFTPVLRSVRLGLWARAAAKVLGRGRGSGDATVARSLRKTHPVGARAAIAQLAAVWRYSASRRRPHGRILLLAGKADEWMDWRVAAAMSRAWGAALRVHPDAGHDLLGEDAPWVGRSVAEWLLPVGASLGPVEL